MMKAFLLLSALLLKSLLLVLPADSFPILTTISRNAKIDGKTTLQGAVGDANRVEGNVDGVVYVNDKCINCAACAMFAPSNFHRHTSDRHHAVYHQPSTKDQIVESRAAMVACPVKAIQVETPGYRHRHNLNEFSQQERELVEQMRIKNKASKEKASNAEPDNLPFPRPLVDNLVWFVGHHNEKSFGACPYLTYVTNNDDDEKEWILIDSPLYCKGAIDAITKLTGEDGPSYLVLTHVDDTADHLKWAHHFPKMKRIFHSGDLGRHNWLGDETLNDVEILLEKRTTQNKLQGFTLDGTPIADQDRDEHDAVIYHTPGHSPGSICLHHKGGGDGILFSGDTLGFTTRTHALTAFPNYGNDRQQQAQTLEMLQSQLDWKMVAPGHGHVRDYRPVQEPGGQATAYSSYISDNFEAEMEAAIAELRRFPRFRR